MILDARHARKRAGVGAHEILLVTLQGRRSVLKDCCYIEDGAVVPPETIVPSFTRFAGSPATCVEELPECTVDLMTDFTKNYYEHFLPARV